MDGTAVVALISLVVTVIVIPALGLAWREREKRFKAEKALAQYEPALSDASQELRLAAAQLRRQALRPGPYRSLGAGRSHPSAGARGRKR